MPRQPDRVVLSAAAARDLAARWLGEDPRYRLEPAPVASEPGDPTKERALEGARALLASKAASDRAAGAFLAAALPSPLAPLDALAALAAKERDPGAKASLGLALALLEARAGTCAHVEILQALIPADDARQRRPPPVVEAAGALALAWACPLSLGLFELTAMRKHLDVTVPAEELPWWGGALGAHLRAALPRLEHVDVDEALAAARSLMLANPAQPAADGAPPRWPPVVTRAWWSFAGRALASPFRERMGRHAHEHDTPAPWELTVDQRRVIAFAAERELELGFATGALAFGSCPAARRRSLLRYAGVVPAGPQDEVVEVNGQRAPLWMALRRLAHRRLERADVRAILAAKGGAFVAALARDVVDGDYATTNERLFASERAAVVLEVFDALVPAPDAERLRDLRREGEGAAEGKLPVGYASGPIAEGQTFELPAQRRPPARVVDPPDLQALPPRGGAR